MQSNSLSLQMRWDESRERSVWDHTGKDSGKERERHIEGKKLISKEGGRCVDCIEMRRHIMRSLFFCFSLTRTHSQANREVSSWRSHWTPNGLCLQLFKIWLVKNSCKENAKKWSYCNVTSMLALCVCVCLCVTQWKTETSETGLLY